ncbi:EamA family transporter [Geothrix paludis]|uniref:EamA family transporter n=1 Tax=Geothrix paludis TaxID=2922722 RepID=UPI001FADBB4F|nr:EamA family transporter [Geothrix paludis]
MLRCFLIAYLGALLVAVGHVLFKIGARQSLGRPLLRVYLNPHTLVGYLILLGVTVMNLYVYRTLPLKYAVVILPFNYVFVGLFSVLFLDERIHRRQWIGAALILAGIVLFNA